MPSRVTIAQRGWFGLLIGGTALVLLTAVALSEQPPPQTITPAREAAYRANNLGVALLEQFDFPRAVAAFRRALTLDSSLTLARLNLGIALYYQGETSGARRELTAARPGLPGRPHADYMLGLIARSENRPDEAQAAFERVRALDPADVGALVNLGQLLRQEQREEEALAFFRLAVAGEPYNATATYGLAQALLRTARSDEGDAAMARFERIRDSGFSVTYSQTYLQQGRYAEAIASTGAEVGLVDLRLPAARFVDRSAAWFAETPSLPEDAGPAGVTLADVDRDGDLDLLDHGPRGTRLLENTGTRFRDISGTLPANVSAQAATGSVVADYDNDGLTDILILGQPSVALVKRTAPGAFLDATATAGLSALDRPARSAAWLDADHDGDLDLALALASTETAGGIRLLQNNGTGRFSDVTAAAQLPGWPSAIALLPTDFDNRRDVDLLVVRPDGRPGLFRNLREGAFEDVTDDAGLGAVDGATMAAAADINKDGFVDLLLPGGGRESRLALSTGVGGFSVLAAPSAVAAATAGQLADYDSDGLIDIVAVSATGLHVVRNLGQSWVDVTGAALPAPATASRQPAMALGTGDLDGDGRLDVVTRGRGGLTMWHGEGSSARTVAVTPRPRVSNRTAVGVKIELRAGSLRHRAETYAATPAPAPADLTFGLGARPGADVVRVLWPSGILQAETITPGARRVVVEELDRKPSSCPYLFTWNGERFEFVTDFLGGGEMGHWEAPGVFAAPDPDEYVRIDGRQLRPRDGRYDIYITNELEEALFLDRAELVAVSHPQHVEVYPNEGLGAPARPFTIYSTWGARPPVAAFDDAGRDVLDDVARADRRYVDGFALERVRGYAADHTLTLTLPAPGPTGRRLLLLTGWTDYAYSKDNVAAKQAGLVMRLPSLEARDESGAWRTAIPSIGLPVGRPQTVVVDLTGVVSPFVRDVRIRSTARVYWDQIRVDVSDGRSPVVVERLQAASADLSWRGFSEIVTPDGYEPFGYDFARTSPHSTWKLLPGRYTRLGDVRPLVAAIDDLFVVSRPGDAMALSFDAEGLAPLPAGWTRTFLLFAHGFSKEMDLRSASPDVLDPLPFRGMTRYPYASPERYPSTPTHQDYEARYNTRVVPRSLPPLDTAR